MTRQDRRRDSSPIASETCLHDPGGLHACWVVRDDGSWWPWLLSPAGCDHNPCRCGCACRHCAPHEQLGYYPLFGLDLCGEPTTTGEPCRRWVGCADPCWQHRRPVPTTAA